jgi:hypothetical protein
MERNKIKTYSEFINEDINTDISNTTNAYNKYKSRVISIANDKTKQSDVKDKNLSDFIAALPENEKGAGDLLRILYSSEKLRLSIEEMKLKKVEIEKEINLRTKELSDMKNKLS